MENMLLSINFNHNKEIYETRALWGLLNHFISSWEEAAAAILVIDEPIFPDYISFRVWMKFAHRRFRGSEAGKFWPDFDLNIS